MVPVVDRPDVMLYDTGTESELSTFYYQAAINEGADFVVGPLGRQAVNAWLSDEVIETPTLVISTVPEELAQENLFGISLSPEQEASKAAQKAFADGHRQALIFRVDSEWGQRVADAFITTWESMGGTVLKNASFPTEISDYSRIIQKLLKLDQSIARQKVLSAQLGFDLKFTPRRRDDADLLFLAANAKQARLIVPQLRFFQAHDLPMYATSYVYSGEPNASVDADLDGVTLGEMKWMLDNVLRQKASTLKSDPGTSDASTEGSNETDATGQDGDALIEGSNLGLQTPPIRPEPSVNLPQSPYANTALDRLYALGFESYQIIPKLLLLRKNEWIQHRGHAMRITVDEFGNIQQHPEWVKFKDGLLETP